MGGQSSFSDPRIDLFITQTPDLATPKLPALLAYQLSLRTPEPPAGSLNRGAAKRGEGLFRNEVRCAACHQSPNFTDVLSGPTQTLPVLHDPSEVGMDPAYAPTGPLQRKRLGDRGALTRWAAFHVLQLRRDIGERSL